MENIFYCIEYSGITKKQLRSKLNEIRGRAVKAVQPNGIFAGKNVDEITFYWFKNWLHPMLKSRTPKPAPYPGCMNDAYWREQNLRHTYENGQQNFNYTLQDILRYVNTP